MKERPILFSGPMVRAILEGRKTQTRRIVKVPKYHLFDNQSPENFIGDGNNLETTLGSYWTGERRWVRESFAIETNFDLDPCDPPFKDGRPVRWQENEDWGKWWEQAHYAATDPMPELVRENCRFETCANNGYCQHWQPSIHMPRWASRITLEITKVRVERVQEISEQDAKAEGVGLANSGIEDHGGVAVAIKDHRTAFVGLWNSINAARGFGWEKNPWVWVIEFKKQKEKLNEPEIQLREVRRTIHYETGRTKKSFRAG